MNGFSKKKKKKKEIAKYSEEISRNIAKPQKTTILTNSRKLFLIQQRGCRKA